MRALQSFTGLEGRTRRGTVFATNEDRAAYLSSRGLAEHLDGPTETPSAAPGTQRSPAPHEVNEEITPVGGGWYEWRGRRYRGHAAAEKAKNLEV